MAIFENEFYIKFREINNNYKLSNKGLLSFLEDVAGMHSDEVGYGLKTINKTNLTWLLLNWKVRVFSRPNYGDTVKVKTWARDTVKIYTYRDFEVYNSNNELIAIASSKWVLLDIKTMNLLKIPKNLMDEYKPEIVKVFKDEPELNKITPPASYNSCFSYVVQRKDIDFNRHMHNTTYLDLAYEVLPEDVYKNADISNVEIMYKKEAKLGDVLKCFYTNIKNSHYVVIKSEDEHTLHAVVKLDEKE